MFLFLFGLSLSVLGQRLVYLNTTKCNDLNLNCYSNNVDGVYVSLEMQNASNVGNIPSFPMSQNELIEINFQVPVYPLRYMSFAMYALIKSDGTLVFAEIASPWDIVDIGRTCFLNAPNLVWGQYLRILISPNIQMVNHFTQDDICTIVIPIPGSTWINFTNPTQKATNLTLIMRFAIDVNNATLLNHLLDCVNESRALIHRNYFGDSPKEYGLPQPPFNAISNVANEYQFMFKQLLENVVAILREKYPSAIFQSESKSFPWLDNLQLPEKGGFACINASVDREGATQVANYFRTLSFITARKSFFLVIGAIHHDFFNFSYYSSLSLYRLTKTNNGADITCLLDNDLRASASDYMSSKQKMILSLTNHFYVTQWGYSTLDLLPNSTQKKVFSDSEVPEGSTIHFLSRTYAKTAIATDSFLPEIIIEFTVD